MHHENVCFVAGLWNTNGLGDKTVKLLCNLKILKIPTYTSWAEFVHGGNKQYFQPHLTKYLIR